METNTPTPPDSPTPLETAHEKFERERLTRRQALKKFGMTSAMATFALFSVDDLARMVGGAMERQARNSKIATLVAQEFQHSGIVLGADMPYYYNTPPPYYGTPPHYNICSSGACGACCTQNTKDMNQCSTDLTNCIKYKLGDCAGNYDICLRAAASTTSACLNPSNQTPCPCTC